jgi:hypothetical protein
MNRGDIRFLVVTILFAFVLFGACSPPAHSGDRQFHTAVEYNDFILEQQNSIIRRMLKLNELYDRGTDKEIRIAFDSLVVQCESSLKCIEQLSAFEEDSVLKTDAHRLFSFYNGIFHKEYKRMLDIFLKGELASDEEVEELNRIVIQVGEQEAKLNEALSKSQQAFSKRYGFEFASNETTN